VEQVLGASLQRMREMDASSPTARFVRLPRRHSKRGNGFDHAGAESTRAISACVVPNPSAKAAFTAGSVCISFIKIS
jgi:hypothetical protein